LATVEELMRALDDSDVTTTTTSLRQPVALRRALGIAVELGLAATANEATNESLRVGLRSFALGQALEQHYEEHPWARPNLYQLGVATAVMTGNPLAERKDLLRRAAREVKRLRPDADGDDVVLWAEALLQHERSTVQA
jgi:hypothetical protein